MKRTLSMIALAALTMGLVKALVVIQLLIP